MSLSKPELFEQVISYCQEVIGGDHLKSLFLDRQIKGYWGTAPTGRPHVAYLFHILNISLLVKAGVNMTILVADYHAALDNNKTEWEALHARTEYYITVIRELLTLTGVDPNEVRFVKGTDHQRGNPAYLDDLFRMSSKITVKCAQKATAEVVQCSENPLLSNCIYPLMQVLDEEHLDCDFEVGGMDQRKIFMFGIDNLPRIGYKRHRCYMLTPMIRGLSKEGKMSSSDHNSKIDLLDTEQAIRKKCMKAYSVDGVVADNAVLQLFQYVVFRMPQFANGVTVTREKKYGGDVHFSNYSELEEAFSDKRVVSIDVKCALADSLINILSPLKAKIDLLYPELVTNAYGSGSGSGPGSESDPGIGL